MALIRPGSLAGQISGRIGGDVWSHNRYGQYVRAGTNPIKVTSAAAMAAKARMSAASSGWEAVAAADKLAWSNWAQTHPGMNRLGESITLTGQAAYVGMTTRLDLLGQLPKAVPPLVPPPVPLGGLSMTGDIGAGDFGLIWTSGALAANEQLWGWAAVCDSSAVNFIKGLLKQCIISPAAQVSPYDCQAQIEARFGALTVGQIVHVVVGVASRDDGQVGPMLRTSVVVSST